jgi:hypothetical protein
MGTEAKEATQERRLVGCEGTGGGNPLQAQIIER